MRPVKGHPQRFKPIGQQFYRFILRYCNKCDERYCFRQQHYVNPKNNETTWLQADWVSEQWYEAAQEVIGEQRIGSTAGQHTKEAASGKLLQDAEKRADSHFARLTDKFKRLCE